LKRPAVRERLRGDRSDRQQERRRRQTVSHPIDLPNTRRIGAGRRLADAARPSTGPQVFPPRGAWPRLASMKVTPVGDIDDPRIVDYRSMRRFAALRRNRTFVAEGTRVVVHLLASPLRVRSLLLEPRWLDEFRPMLEARPEADLEVFVAPREEVQKIVGFQVHHGAMAVADEPTPPDLFDLALRKRDHVFVALDGVSSAENVGAIVRSMAGLGADGLIIDPATCDPYVRRAARVSMGGIFRTPVWRVDDLPATISRLRARCGTRAVAAHNHAPVEDLDRVELDGGVLVALGSEATGLSPATIAACDAAAMIPMRGDWSCINVGAAAAVFLWEIARRRR
jgi:tRNA G18 (ribose-2'-O)-methylase SpoU